MRNTKEDLEKKLVADTWAATSKEYCEQLARSDADHAFGASRTGQFEHKITPDSRIRVRRRMREHFKSARQQGVSCQNRSRFAEPDVTRR